MLSNQSKMRSIQALETNITIKESLAKIIEISANKGPAPFEKVSVEAIWS
jgi:hypothetical protein